MAVRVRLTARGAPTRMAAACFPIASTPVRGFGGWYHRVTATNGTVPLPAYGAPTQRQIPDGPTPGHSFNTPVIAAQWDIVRPALPRVLPWAGGIPHGVPDQTYTPVVGQAAAGQTPMTSPTRMMRYRNRVPIAQGRITNQPKPRFFWKVQGGGGQPA